MNIFEELQARGLIAQVTDEKEIKELIQEIEFIPFFNDLNVLVVVVL